MKSVPRLPGHIIDRPRLMYSVDRLLTGECRIATIWAAAGSGKSTLLQQWENYVKSHRVDVTYIDSQELFNDLAAFFDQGERTDRDGAPRRRFLVVQDAHSITTATSRRSLLSIMQDLPVNVCLIMVGRYQPQWSLALLQAPGIVTELRMADLAFDEAETVALSQKSEVILDSPTLRRLFDRTGGWAAAVVTAMQRLRDAGMAGFQVGDDDPSVAEFLKNEVLDSLSSEETTVLTKAALRQYVPGALAVELAENSYTLRILDKIAQRISFVTSREGVYQFHPVLLGHLRSSSHQHDNSAMLRGHVIAARWHHARGEAMQAVTEAALSRQPAVVATAVDRFGLELILKGEPAPMLRALEILAPEPDHPAVVATKLLLAVPDFVDMMHVSHLFDQALTEKNSVHAQDNKWRAVVVALQCFQKNSRVPLADQLARLQSSNITILRRRELALDVIITTAEAWAANRLGDTQKAQTMLHEVRITAKRAGFTWLYFLSTQLTIDIANHMGEWHITAALEDELDEVAGRYAQPVRDRVSAIAAITVAHRSFRLCERLPIDSLERVLTQDPDDAMFGLDIQVIALLNFSELDSVDNPRPALEALDQLAGAHARHSPQLFSIVALRMVDLALRLDGRQRATELAERFVVALGPECLESKTLHFLLRRTTRTGASAESDLIAAVEPQTTAQHLDAHASAWHSGALIAAWLLLARASESQGRRAEATARLNKALWHAHRLRQVQPFAAIEGDGANMLATRAGTFGPLASTKFFMNYPCIKVSAK